MMRCGAVLLTLALLGVCLPVSAQGVVTADYGDLARQLDGRIAFERLPRRPEPGLNLNAPYRTDGATLGERLAGQRIAAGAEGHDRVTGTPRPPLAIRAGAAGRSLAVAFHRGFGSNALFPLGRAGFPALGARGEGAVAVLFDADQGAVGLRIHSDYADPLGGRGRVPAAVTIRFYARDGREIGRHTHATTTGIRELGYHRDGPGPGIAAMVIENRDPGGIAIDDIIYSKAALLF